MEARGGSPPGITEPPPKSATSPDGDTRHRGSLLQVVIGVSLVLVAVGAVIVAGSFDRPPSANVVGRDAPVNLGAGTLRDINAHNSPTLARSPVSAGNLAVVSRIDTPFFSCALHVSTDDGASWSQTAIPAPKGEEAKCFAPDVAFGADGTLYLSFVTLRGNGNVPNAVWLSRSTDGGRTLSEPVKARGRLAFQVRLAADPVKPRRLYMTWLQANDVAPLRFTNTENPIQVARSDNGGISWSRPVRVSDPARERVVAPSPAVGPKGELYVLYLDLGEDRLDYEAQHRGRGGPPYPGAFKLVLARSRNEGKAWQESVAEDSLRAIHRFIVFLPISPSVAVDRSGRVYAAFHDRRLGDPDVWLWSLGPGASAWEGPTRVNDTAQRDGTWQYLPKVSVAPDGRLDVLYYDRRSDPRNVMNNVSLQSSFDAGKTFTPALQLASSPFDSRIGYTAREGLPDLGSRLALVSGDQQALAVWTDTRAGTPRTQKQDLGIARVAVSKPSSGVSGAVEYGLRYGGLGAGAVGLLLLALWLRPHWARRRGANEGVTA